MTALSHLDPDFGSVFAIEAVNEPIMDAAQTPGYGDCKILSTSFYLSAMSDYYAAQSKKTSSLLCVRSKRLLGSESPGRLSRCLTTRMPPPRSFSSPKVRARWVRRKWLRRSPMRRRFSRMSLLSLVKAPSSWVDTPFERLWSQSMVVLTYMLYEAERSKSTALWMFTGKMTIRPTLPTQRSDPKDMITISITRE